jgi:ferredoxin
MPSIIIDGRTVSFKQGRTILQAASAAGIPIPFLCSFEGIEPPTSCFVCIVKIQGKKGMIPSCATPAREGMILESDSEEVRWYRRKALELLLSEHAGDCEAPCRRICPADLDIPAMARYIASQDLERAALTVWDRLPLPGILGCVCPAPCEKGCRRKQADGAVSIRELHKSVADTAFASEPAMPHPALPSSGKTVAVVGAGPAGLASAYYLSRNGHACTIFDEKEQPGGMLRYGTDRAALPLCILEREIGVISGMGVEFKMRCRIGEHLSLDDLLKAADAVVLAPGTQDAQSPSLFNVKTSPKGIDVESGTFTASRSGIFACGGAVIPGRMAARAVGQGRLTAASVHRYLGNAGKTGALSRLFDSRLGRLHTGEMEQFVSTDLSSLPVGNGERGSFRESTVTAAARCLQCDCGKKDHCELRSYAQEYGINREQYRSGARKRVGRKRYAGGLMHEPGKCISCGRCIGITAADGALPGLSFQNRGFDVTVGAPFDADMDTAMGRSLDRCRAACPTGALWNWKRPGATS